MYLIDQNSQNQILPSFLLGDNISGPGVSYKFLQIFPDSEIY